MLERAAAYQVTYVFLRFGNVELHLVFNKEFESQVVFGGIDVMSLWSESKKTKHVKITKHPSHDKFSPRSPQGASLNTS